MKKVKVLYFTTTVTVDGDSSAQDQFYSTMEFEDNETLADIGEAICRNIEEYTFIYGDEPTHYYRTSTITDFIIKEIKE